MNRGQAKVQNLCNLIPGKTDKNPAACYMLLCPFTGRAIQGPWGPGAGSSPDIWAYSAYVRYVRILGARLRPWALATGYPPTSP
jgi:hypothetical protein